MTPEPRLAEFLADLATDSERIARFASNPAEARRLMDAAGLSADEQRALGSGSVAAVYDALATQAGSTGRQWAGPDGVMKPARKPSRKRPATKRRPAKRGPAKKRKGGTSRKASR